ncbi:hypothetical protein COT49_00965 [candidate division WWE3 bacterium CG08_land_8_20_14_0_20_40_13]|uniref:ATP synthase F1 complex delta/epsilon subunit N-terminal domain-containing protein n=1 Tax=candidate division WWE3 bacterium CG08_land_8_20_14_0_20_40_13 TaxID=1975084 RepID=A0A2H0XGM1_UNCKA|nr:MAG: hypothetical protein COT49_00965 [candidate division WWE3 bacterium CG08_land_8_20_14_0_20_40_13]
MPNQLLTVEVKTLSDQPVKVTAYSVSSTNGRGRFDILPNHANFITLIKDFLIVKTVGNEKTIKFKEGVLYCKKDKVKIFIEN